MSIRKFMGVVIDADTLDGLNAVLAANQIPVLNAAAKMLLANLEDAVCSETEADNKVIAGNGLFVSHFDFTPATGTFITNPHYINDGTLDLVAGADTINQYADVLLILPRYIKQWRQYGFAGNNGSGRWKIQYWNGGAWQDWETDIPTRTTADWSDWASPAVGVKSTNKIRLVCTTVDTEFPKSYIGELEVKY